MEPSACDPLNDPSSMLQMSSVNRTYRASDGSLWRVRYDPSPPPHWCATRIDQHDDPGDTVYGPTWAELKAEIEEWARERGEAG